jgi:hypothetical protein
MKASRTAAVVRVMRDVNPGLFLCRYCVQNTSESATVHVLKNILCIYACMHALTRVCPKVSGLAAWSENCKWYSFLPLDAVVSLFCESV